MAIVKATKANHSLAAAHAAPAPKLKVKHVMLLDTGDGAFTDSSVKVKPHKDDPSKVVFKCVDAGRLLKALTEAGLQAVKVLQGRKHYIAIVDAELFQTALVAAQSAAPMLAAPAHKALPGKEK